MRIALVHMRHAHSGGAERYLNLISSHLVASGHQVVILCRSHASPPPSGIEIVKLRPISIGASARMWNFAMAVEEHVKSVQYDLVYALGKTWSHDVIRLGGGCHQTYLKSAHAATCSPLARAIGVGGRKHRMALEIEQRALSPGAFKHVITNSEMTKRDVISTHGIPADKIRVIHNGADVEQFHPRLRSGPGSELRRLLGWSDEHQVLLFLGTGYGRKGLDIVLEATAELSRERPMMRLIVAGRDSSRSRYEALAAKLGISSRTAFLGSRDDPEYCYAAADVYALPTRFDPFANTTVEALASGLPTITTKSNGGHELIEEGIDGSVLPQEAAPTDLADRVNFWFDNREVGSLAARAKAEENQAASKMRETQTLLEELVSS